MNKEIKTKAREILISAKELISDENKFCRHYYAIDDLGVQLDSASCRAVKWCSLGALELGALELKNKLAARVFGEELQENGSWWGDNNDSFYVARDYLNIAAKEMGFENLVKVNDTPNSHGLVMQMFDMAIKLAEENQL
jgi:hypothetical protein